MALKLKVEKTMVKDNTERVKNAESSIVQQAQQIALKVSEESFNALAGRVANAEASMTVQANAIALKVSQSNFNALAERVGSTESSIVQQANAIALKVSSTDFTGNTIASLINQSATTIKLQASKIILEGLITANGNFKVLADGSIEAVNAKLSGAITATKMVAAGYTNYYGEIGVSGGAVGLGLFDLTYGTEAFFEVLETDAGQGFILRDRKNVGRLHARLDRTSLRGPNGYEGLMLGTANGYLQSPNERTYIYVSDNEAGVVVNGVVKVRWN